MTTTTDIEAEAVTILGALQHMPVLDRHRVLRLCFERAGDALAKERDAAAKLLEELDAAMGGEAAKPVVDDENVRVANRARVLERLRLVTIAEAALTAGDLAKLTGIPTGDVSAALAWLKAHGEAATVTGTRRWYAVVEGVAF